MKIILTLTIISIFSAGCAMQRTVNVVTSQSTVRVQHITLDDDNTMVCDPEGCKLVR